MSTIRVLHIVTVPATVKYLISSIIRRQLQLGYQVEIVCGSGEFLEDLKANIDIPIHELPLSRDLLRIDNVKAFLSLIRIIRKNKFHIVHTHTPVASFIGRIAAVLARTPIIIYHMRGSWWDSPKFVVRFSFTIFERLPGFFTTHTFTINCTDAMELVKRKIASANNVTCLHCGSGGVDISRFNPILYSYKDQLKLRQDLGLSGGDLIIGFIGRLVREKGIVDLVLAFTEIVNIMPTARLLIVGGTLESERDQETSSCLQNIIKSKNLDDKIVFTGFRDDAPALLSIMDVLVLPSYREGFGMVVAEAAAMEKPVVTTKTRGGIESVIDLETGILITPGDIQALSSSLIDLLSDKDLRNYMGKNGRRRAEKHFSELIIFNAIQEKYTDLLLKAGLPFPEKERLR